VAIGIDGFAEKSLGPFTHLAEPIGGYQFTGVGIGISERKNLSPELFKAFELAGFIYN
jgi:hypothetical protein